MKFKGRAAEGLGPGDQAVQTQFRIVLEFGVSLQRESGGPVLPVGTGMSFFLLQSPGDALSFSPVKRVSWCLSPLQQGPAAPPASVEMCATEARASEEPDCISTRGPRNPSCHGKHHVTWTQVAMTLPLSLSGRPSA